MREIKYPYIIKDGKGTVSNTRSFRKELEGLKDGRYELVIRKYVKKRSFNQNSVLHWYISEIADETGMDKDVVKEVLKKKFLTIDVLDENGDIMAEKSTGEILQYVQHTSQLTTTDFNVFTEEIRLWANEFLGLQLPLPNQEVELKFSY